GRGVAPAAANLVVGVGGDRTMLGDGARVMDHRLAGGGGDAALHVLEARLGGAGHVVVELGGGVARGLAGGGGLFGALELLPGAGQLALDPLDVGMLVGERDRDLVELILELGDAVARLLLGVPVGLGHDGRALARDLALEQRLFGAQRRQLLVRDLVGRRTRGRRRLLVAARERRRRRRRAA